VGVILLWVCVFPSHGDHKIQSLRPCTAVESRVGGRRPRGARSAEDSTLYMVVKRSADADEWLTDGGPSPLGVSGQGLPTCRRHGR
jgi:hypothetical protein